MIGKEQIRAFVATPKGKLAIAGACLILCWVFLLVYFFGDAITAIGDPKSLEKARKDLDRQKAEYDKVRVDYDELESQKKRYREITDSAWKESREDQVKNKLHNSITQAAAKLEFKLNRIGAVNIGKLNNEVYYADVDIAADGKLDEIVNLIMAMEDIRPAPVWKQLVIRPDNRPRLQATSGIDSINLANQILTVERTRVVMSGTLRVICTDESAESKSKKGGRK